MDVTTPSYPIRGNHRDGMYHANHRLAACLEMVGFISYHGSHVVPRDTEQTGRRSIQKINQQLKKDEDTYQRYLDLYKQAPLVICHDGSQFIPDEGNEQEVREHGKKRILNVIKIPP